MAIFDWIEQVLKPKLCTSVEFIYDHMDSQSGRSLPIIYQPFDANQRSHWQARGALFDYLFSTQGKRLLDFGPGDGWPSLIVAPFVEEVVGIDGSRRRVDVCTENARRLGISNATFIHVEPGMPLPFSDNSFDGVMAASSVEQTPDPEVTLREFLRVLRPGGRARISYEALGRYRHGQEREAWLWEINDYTCRLILVDRDIDRERARQYSLTFSKPSQEMMEFFTKDRYPLAFEMVTVPLMEKASSALIDVQSCPLVHPSGRTLASWLSDTGFREVLPSHSGAWFAGCLFGQLAEESRPRELVGVDDVLQPLVNIAVQMAAPIDIDPMITAVK